MVWERHETSQEAISTIKVLTNGCQVGQKIEVIFLVQIY